MTFGTASMIGNRTRPVCRFRRTAAALALVLPLLAFAADSSDPAPLSAKALLLDVARAGDRLVAVGAFGNVVVSDDEGRTWAQVIVPARSLLTGVSFPDARHGWAVGHDGVIIATADGGRTWARQDSGKDPDTVYLDVHFADPQRGYAVGAYGKFLRTTDGGRTWNPGRPTPDEMHFNRISRTSSGRLVLAGEAGTLLASDDEGATWETLEPPYDGSLFGFVEAGGSGAFVVCGLRGNILFSPDGGGTWVEHAGEVPVLLMSGVRHGKSGRIILGGQGGNFYISRDGGRAFAHWKPGDFGTSVAEMIETADGSLLVVGEAGARRLELP